jgi:hypothetical protein
MDVHGHDKSNKEMWLVVGRNRTPLPIPPPKSLFNFPNLLFHGRGGEGAEGEGGGRKKARRRVRGRRGRRRLT